MGSYISREDFEDLETGLCEINTIKHNKRHIDMNKHNGGNPQVSQSCKTSPYFKSMWS